MDGGGQVTTGVGQQFLSLLLGLGKGAWIKIGLVILLLLLIFLLPPLIMLYKLNKSQDLLQKTQIALQLKSSELSSKVLEEKKAANAKAMEAVTERDQEGKKKLIRLQKEREKLLNEEKMLRLQRENIKKQLQGMSLKDLDAYLQSSSR